MNEAGKPAKLLDQQAALSSYLEALLQEVPSYVAEEAVTPPAPRTDAPPAPKSPPDTHVLPEAPPDPQAPQTAPAAEAGPPAWGRERFQCLVFKVAGLSLAVPLVKLSGVRPFTGELTAMPNRSALFLGLLRHQERNVTVIDTALAVLPDAHRDRMLAPPAERLGHIILLDEGRWGLACDCLGEVLTLAPEDVRWRGAAGKRPWLAGTVLQHLCALLDADAFLARLKTGVDAPLQP